MKKHISITFGWEKTYGKFKDVTDIAKKPIKAIINQDFMLGNALL